MSRWNKITTNLVPNNNKYPPSDTYILVALRNRFVRESYYFSDCHGKHFSSVDRKWDGAYTIWVTHWMPLPIAPKYPLEKSD